MSLSAQQAAQTSLSCMDLTSLNNNDTEQTIIDLCQQAHGQSGSVAAICVFPQFIATAKAHLAPNIKIATVTNFPDGSSDIARAVTETQQAVLAGADEVDVVMPYKALIAGDEDVAAQLISACKKACGESAKLKVIIESGELQTDVLIAKASEIAITAGADFIKTSTGKVTVNATLRAAEIMLKQIKLSGKAVGFKAAGGVRTVSEATQYIELVHTIMGESWLTPENFRFGASGLLNDVLAVLNGEQNGNKSEGY